MVVVLHLFIYFVLCFSWKLTLLEILTLDVLLCDRKRADCQHCLNSSWIRVSEQMFHVHMALYGCLMTRFKLVCVSVTWCPLKHLAVHLVLFRLGSVSTFCQGGTL